MRHELAHAFPCPGRQRAGPRRSGRLCPVEFTEGVTLQGADSRRNRPASRPARSRSSKCSGTRCGHCFARSRDRELAQQGQAGVRRVRARAGDVERHAQDARARVLHGRAARQAAAAAHRDLSRDQRQQQSVSTRRRRSRRSSRRTASPRRISRRRSHRSRVESRSCSAPKTSTSATRSPARRRSSSTASTSPTYAWPAASRSCSTCSTSSPRRKARALRLRSCGATVDCYKTAALRNPPACFDSCIPTGSGYHVDRARSTRAISRRIALGRPARADAGRGKGCRGAARRSTCRRATR